MVAPRTTSRLAWGLLALDLALLAAGLLLELTHEAGDEDVAFIYGGIGLVLGYGGVGALIASRDPRNVIGWLFCAIATTFAITAFSDEFVTWGLVTGRRSLVVPFAWLQSWIFVAALEAVPLVLLLFPNGRPPSSRWRWLVPATVTLGGAACLGFVVQPGSLEAPDPYVVPNPTAIAGAPWLGSVLLTIGGMGSLGIALAALASLILRFRRSAGDERQQIRWLAYVGVIGLVLLVGAVVTGGGPVGDVLFFLFFLVLAVGIPAATGLAILRYDLYDIDLVIKKTVVYAILAALLFALGAPVAWAAGTLVFRVSGRGEASWLLAGIVVGTAVWPLRRLATRFADRLVYGRRATPYEVLSAFSDRVAETYAAEDVLERMAQVLGEAVGADAATVWLGRGDRAHPAATWPATAPIERVPPPSAVEVRHQGAVLGALSVRTQASDPMTPAKERLIRDLAGQAGLVLRNAALIEELRESRRRIVAAQDERAKKLERNIHDGAQQQLVALAVKLGLTERLMASDPAKASSMLRELKGETERALEDLRDLARGIYPPLLADKGLGAALESQARKSTVAVTVETDGIGRYPEETEAAVYFSCLEALQNVAKYAEASTATVRLEQRDGALAFEVSDDGRGFDAEVADRGSGLQGIADRLAALGGEMRVRSSPGRGTTVEGRVPVPGSTPASPVVAGPARSTTEGAS